MEPNVKKQHRTKGAIIAVSCVVVALIVVLVLLLTQCSGEGPLAANDGKLIQQLTAPGDATITLDEDIILSGPVTVNGNKTIVGKGTITLQSELEGTWPEGDAPTWGMGCAKLEAQDASGMGAMLQVESGASLTLGGDVILDANNKGNGVLVQDGGKLTLDTNAQVLNGRYANLVICTKAEADLSGGKLLDGNVYNVINYGTLALTGAEVSGAKAGAAVYSTGTVQQTAGLVSGAAFHNVYVAAGSLVMTGGSNDGAAKDGIVVAEGAQAQVTGGTITNCNHGICNNGTLTAGEVTLSECGIMNNGTGTMELKDTTVDTSEVYCLANNGGKVTAENFTARGCDTAAVYNFSGEMVLTNLTVTDGRDGNLSNVGGTMTVNGGTLGVCRDKSVSVGNGKVILNQVKIQGTTNDKYGIYAFGGELVLNDSSIENVSSTAVKVDAGSTVELNNVTIKEVGQNGFQTDGGKIIANHVTMENMGSHGIYNNGGEVIANDLTIHTVKKNGIQHKYGTTTVDGFTLSGTGNHGAYLAEGTLTVKNGSMTEMSANGFYLPEGQSKLILEDTTISGTVQQGINNSSEVEIKNVTISDSGKNGIYNKPGGVVTINGLTVSNVAEHGINNKAELHAENVTIIHSGADSNGIQNNGTMTLKTVSITDSRNHGIYNNGELNAEGVIIDTTADNGLYNDKGTAQLRDLTIRNTTAQGVNNNSIITLTDVKITASGKNGIYNSDGKAVIEKLEVVNPGEHGINNVAEMTATDVTITGSGAGKNGIQNSGTLVLHTVGITASRNHGIYNNGTLSGSNVAIDSTSNNGIYNDKGTITEIDGLKISNVPSQGINNTGTLTVKNVQIANTGKNGIYNNAGTARIVGITIQGVSEHGISNDFGGQVLLMDAVITGSGKGSNCIQNKATMTLSGVKAVGSANHGIYNDATLVSEGTVTIENAAVNGIYNYGGNVTLDNTLITGSGEHGVNNAGTLTGKHFTITGVAANGIQNSGTMSVTGSAIVTNSGKHGMYNGKQFTGENITIENAFDLLVSNSGDMVVRTLTMKGTAHKALYNSGYAELYTVTVDGSEVTNGGNAEYLLDNNGGVLDLTDATVLDANGTAVHIRGKGAVSLTNVILDRSGNYGIFVEGGSTVSAHGLVINNVTKNTQVAGAEGIAIKLAGKATMMDHVTLGAYSDSVTGSGVEISKETSGLASTALQLDADKASYSGYDLTIVGVSKGNGIYNKGQLYVTNMTIDTANHGLVSRYRGWATLSGNIIIRNIKNNPISIYGPEKGSYVNGVTLTSGASLTIDTAGSHAINNKGSFLAAADSTLTVKNITGKNVNAINNQSGATMTLGKVTVDGLYVNITMYNETTINSNSGTALMNSGVLELNGAVEIRNIFHKPENNMAENSNGSGLVVKNGGAVTGTGSVTIIGNQTAPEGYEGYLGLHNGIFITKCTMAIHGDIHVEGAKNQGIYVADDHAALTAGNITVKNVTGNGIYVNKASGALTATGTITVDTTGQHGVNNNGGLTAGAVTVKNAGTASNHNGINNNGGTLKVAGAIVVENIAGHGVSNNKVLTAASLSATNVGMKGAANGIQNSGSGNMTITGAAVIDTATAHGIYNKKTVSFGSFTAKNVKRSGINNDGGSFTVTGALTIDTTGEKAIGNTGTITADTISVTNVTTGYGLHSKGGSVKAQSITIDGVKGDVGVYLESKAVVEAVTMIVKNTKSHCIQAQHANTIKVETLAVMNSENGNGLRLYNKNSQPTVTITTMIAYGCKQRGLTADAGISADNLSVGTLYWHSCSEGVKGSIAGCVGTIVNSIPDAYLQAGAQASALEAN